MEMMNVMRLWVPAWQWGPLRSRKWGINSLWPRRRHPQGAPNVRSQHINHILRWSWSTWVSSLGKCKENPWQLGFCDFGTQGWTRHLWRFCKSLQREVEGQYVRRYFGSVTIWKGAWAGKGPIQVTQMRIWGDLCGVLWCRPSRTVYCKGCRMVETVCWKGCRMVETVCWKGCVLRLRKV